ncbi:Lipase member K, partial [Tetrabaena socialis]
FVLPHGYPLEEHFATTPDGYILRLFRLGSKGDAGAAAGRPVAFLQHPLMGSSVDYVVMGPGRSDPDDPADAPAFWGFSWDQHAALDLPAALDYAAAASGQERAVFVGYSQGTTIGLAALASVPRVAARLTAAALLAPVASVDYVVMGPGRSVAFMLADAGYDVWLTNVRGNRFSRNHTRLDPDDPADAPAFWGFSWDQHAALDLPAALDYAAAASGQERAVFVGYSQGTTIGLAALASVPRVAARLTAAALLAPVAFVTGMSSPLFRIMVTWRFDRLFRWAGMREYGRHIPRLAEAAAAFCGRHPAPCERYLFLMCGANPRGNLDRSLLPDVMRFLPSGTSVQNMEHWGQEAYNSAVPPSYDLGSIATPLALFSGGHDSLADPGDVALLAAALQPRGAVRLHHFEPDYGHLDFGVGEDAADRIYPALLNFLQQHTAAAVPGAAAAA